MCTLIINKEVHYNSSWWWYHRLWPHNMHHCWVWSVPNLHNRCSHLSCTQTDHNIYFHSLMTPGPLRHSRSWCPDHILYFHSIRLPYPHPVDHWLFPGSRFGHLGHMLWLHNRHSCVLGCVCHGGDPYSRPGCQDHRPEYHSSHHCLPGTVPPPDSMSGYHCHRPPYRNTPRSPVLGSVPRHNTPGYWGHTPTGHILQYIIKILQYIFW